MHRGLNGSRAQVHFYLCWSYNRNIFGRTLITVKVTAIFATKVLIFKMYYEHVLLQVLLAKQALKLNHSADPVALVHSGILLPAEAQTIKTELRTGVHTAADVH